MRNKQEILEQLIHTPEDWRFVKCTDKEAWGNKYTKETTFTLEEVVKQQGNGVGVLLGRHSLTTIEGNKYGLGAVDLDGTGADINFKHHVGIDVSSLPKTVSVASGRKDRKQMFFWIPEEKIDVLDAKEIELEGYANFELRIGNQYSMVAGFHPKPDSAGKYFWINSPLDVPVAIAPPLLLEGWENLSEDKQKDEKTKVVKEKKSYEQLVYDSSRVKRYLKRYFVPVNNWNGRKEWIRVIQALRHLSLEWEESTGVKDKHLEDAHEWCFEMDDYDYKELEKVWYSFKRINDGKKVVTINSFFDEAMKHPDWEKDEVKLQEELKEKPKRKKSELLNDLLEHAKNKDSDAYAEDFAEMETRFRRSPIDINNDLLNQLRNSYGQKNYKVGLVDMSKVKDLEYLLEGFLVRGENHQIFAGAGMGKTSLLAGMIKAGYKGVGFLNQTRHREPFRTLWVSCDGGSSRWKAVYDDMGLDDSMVDVIGADREQGLTNWKWTIPNLIELRRLLEKEKYGLVVFDPIKGMMSSTGFKYTDNEHADSICMYLREIIAEPFDLSVVLLNHLSTDGSAGSGAKRWGEAVAVNIEIKKVIDGGEENNNERKLAMWKNPISGRTIFDYGLKDGVFVPTYKKDIIGDCYAAMKKYVEEINFKTGQSVFSRQDLLKMPNYSRAHIDRTKEDHLKKGGIFKPQKDSNGKVQRGKFVLKTQFKLNKEEGEELKKYEEHLAYWDADPDTIPKHLKTVSTLESAKMNYESMVEGKNDVIDI